MEVCVVVVGAGQLQRTAGRELRFPAGFAHPCFFCATSGESTRKAEGPSSRTDRWSQRLNPLVADWRGPLLGAVGSDATSHAPLCGVLAIGLSTMSFEVPHHPFSHSPCNWSDSTSSSAAPALRVFAISLPSRYRRSAVLKSCTRILDARKPPRPPFPSLPPRDALWPVAACGSSFVAVRSIRRQSWSISYGPSKA